MDFLFFSRNNLNGSHLAFRILKQSPINLACFISNFYIPVILKTRCSKVVCPVIALLTFLAKNKPFTNILLRLAHLTQKQQPDECWNNNTIVCAVNFLQSYQWQFVTSLCDVWSLKRKEHCKRMCDPKTRPPEISLSTNRCRS